MAKLKTIALEMAKPSEFQLTGTSTVENESDLEQAGKESLPLTVSSEKSQSQDALLFGYLWPLGEEVVLDPTVGRATFRHQCERLKVLGYQCDSSTQVWQKRIVS